MGLAETAELAIKISLTGNAQSGIRNLKSSLGGLGSAAGRVARGVAIGAGAAVGVASAVVVKNVKSGLESLAELESATSSVDGAIKQMGLTGKVTAAQVATWANEIEASVGAAFDDKAITQATTTLIRFGKITEDNLRPAMQVITDLATKTGDVDSAATLLAKALADPTKAAGKLARSGVILTKAEQDQIEAFVKAGKVGKAQTLILDALAKSTKGAALASQGPYARSLSVLRDVTEDAQRALATGFLPVIEEVRNILTEELAKPGTLNRIKEFGTTLAGGLRGLVQTVRGLPWDQISTAVGGIVDLGKNLGKAFLDMPAEAKTLILSLAALNKLSGGAVVNVAVDFAKGALNQFLGKGSPANPMYVVPVGGGLTGGAPVGVAGAAKGGIGLVGKMFLVGEAVGLVAAVVDVANNVKDGLSGNASEIHKTLTQSLASPQSIDDLRTKLAAIDTGIDSLPKDPLGGWVTSGALAELQSMRSEVVNSIGLLGRQNLQPLPDKITDKQRASFTALRDKLESSRIATVTRLGAVQSETARGSQAIVNAIRGIQRPIVNVNVSQSYARITYSTGTTLSRYSGKLIPTS